MATVMCVDASDEEEGDAAETELAGAVVLDELLVTEQPASASAATAASGRVRLDHRLADEIVIFPDISSSFGRD